MTFAELQRGVFDDLQYQAQPKPGVQDRVRRYLNEGLERVLRRPRLKNLRLGSVPLQTNPDQGFYGLPEMLERIDYVIDLTNKRRLPFRTRDWYRQCDPAATGTPSVWIPEGIGPVLRQPRFDPATNETRIYVASQSPADVTQIVRVRAMYFLGNEFDITTQLQGTTYVQIGTIAGAGPFPLLGPTTISAISINESVREYVFLSDLPAPTNTRTDFIAHISPWAYSSRHLGMRLYPAPSTELLYEIEGQRVIPRMIRDEDEPPFSADFHEMLQCYARARFYRKDGRLQQSRDEMAEFERYALDLTAHVEYPVNYKPVAGKWSSHGSGWSDLGPSYPADRLGLIGE